MTETYGPGRYFRKVVVAGAWVFGVWTPLQTAYEYVDKQSRHLHLKIDLQHVMLYACYVTGSMIYRLVVAAICFALLVGLFALLGALKNRASITEIVSLDAALALLAVGGVLGFVWLAFENITDPNFRPPKISGFSFTSKEAVFFTSLGAVLLSYIYLLIYRSIKTTIKQMKEEGELES